MPRSARIVLPGIPHHITQRGNNRQDVFHTSVDRTVYLSFLTKQSVSAGLNVLGYCLMPNHVHLVATPNKADSLATAVGRTHFLYALYFNSVYNRSGHLWQNRFYSCGLDDERLWTVLRYVERNPVRASIVNVAWDYAWSSAAVHAGEAEGRGLLDLTGWREKWSPSDWKEVLGRGEEDRVLNELRSYTKQGLPLCGEEMLSSLERALGHSVRPLPVGRPKKGKTSDERR
ncbi:MAG: transposase [Candidatus Eisenbacteria bacterium]|nr:transposase [Candidatus Eisenbacteria bacterium]